MNQLKLSFVLGTALLASGFSALGGCSDDDGADVLPKDPTAQAGSGGGAGNGGAGGGAGTGGGGNGGGAGMGGTSPDAGLERPECPPAPPPMDAGAGEDGGVADGGTDAGDGGSAPRELSFAADIHPIFAMYCRPCHQNETSGGHNVAADDPREAYSYLVDMAASLVPRVNGGGMPPECIGFPGDPGCITVAELQLIQSWEAQCYPP